MGQFSIHEWQRKMAKQQLEEARRIKEEQEQQISEQEAKRRELRKKSKSIFNSLYGR